MLHNSKNVHVNSTNVCNLTKTGDSEWQRGVMYNDIALL